MNNNPTALITGAAQRIGAATAKHLHQQGCNIIIHCNQSLDEAEQLCQALNQQRANSATVFQMPLDAFTQLNECAQATIASFGRLDYLVNNASGFYPTPLSEATQQDWDALINSNLRGAYFLIQALAPALKQQRGAIVNMIDIYAQRPLDNHSIYCIAKAGLAMLTQSLAKELAPAVRVNGVSPGAILWPKQGGEETMNELQKQQLLDKVPLQRRGEASDIASAIKFLLMDAPYITGQVIAVDGGRSLCT